MTTQYAGATAVAGSSCLVSGCYTPLTVTRYTITNDMLPPEFRVKAVFMTDQHFNALGNGQKAQRDYVAQVNEEKPDIIFLGGDLQNNTCFNSNTTFGITASDPTPEDIAEICSDLKAPCGVFGVPGNHDWDKSGDRIMTAMKHKGIQMLENEIVPVTIKNVDFNIVGVPDYTTRWRHCYENNHNFIADLYNHALDRPAIILSHNPITYRTVPENPYAVVQLSGHTHGGQIRFGGWTPFKPIDSTPDTCLYGLVKRPDTAPLIVSSGIGTSRMPGRNVPKEIVSLTISGPRTRTPGLSL